LKIKGKNQALSNQIDTGSGVSMRKDERGGTQALHCSSTCFSSSFCYSSPTAGVRGCVKGSRRGRGQNGRMAERRNGRQEGLRRQMPDTQMPDA